MVEYNTNNCWICRGLTACVCIGKGVKRGIVTNLDTSGFEKDENIYVSPDKPGELIGELDMAKHLLSKLTGEERLELFRDYCPVCGRPDHIANHCYCWNSK